VSNGWSSQYQAVLILPGGATSGARLVLDGTRDAILEYNAANELVGSWAASAGNDGLGNNYPQGIAIGMPDDPQVVIQVAPDGHSGLIFFPTGNTDIVNSSAIQTFQENGTGAASYDQLQILGAENNTQLDSVLSTWLSSSTDGTQDPQIQDYYHDPTGTYHLYRLTSFRGTTITGAVTGVQPATGGSRTAPALPETWHTAALATGFTTSVSDQAPRYRLEGIAGGIVRLDGVVYSSAAVAAGATMFTLPTGYRPTIRKRWAGLSNASGYTTVGETLFEVLPTGAVTIGPAASASGQQIVLDGATFPID
jgi:hypothetical protein